jgi:hypothetical protein
VEYQVELELEIMPTDRKGVTRLVMRAKRPQDEPYAHQVAVYSCEYPTAAVESFEACLYRSAIQIGRVLAARYAHPSGKA